MDPQKPTSAPARSEFCSLRSGTSMQRHAWRFALVVLGVLAFPPQAHAQQYRAGEVLVQFRPGTPRPQRTAILNLVTGRLRRSFAAVGVDHFDLPANANVNQIVSQLLANPAVLAAQPNYERRIVAAAPPNDPYWLNNSLWGLAKIKMPAVWTNFGTGNGTVVIADIDTGVNYNHPDLAQNIWTNPNEIPGNGIDDDGNDYIDDVHGIDAINHDSDPMDDNGHGTHTAGTIAAIGNNGVGVVGVNWNAKILPCKFLDVSGSGYDSGAIECFNYLVALRSRAINVRVSSSSWGSPRNGGVATALKNAIDAAGNAGIVNIFAAGNDGTNNDTSPFDPASFTSSSIIAVASSDQNDNRSGFSNYGATSVDLAAPGSTIVSTYAGTYGTLSGTSMATPHVAGAAALLLASQPQLTVSALKTLMLNNVERLAQWSGVVVSGGRLDVQLMFLAAFQNQPPSVFAKTTPVNGATGLNPSAVALAWQASTGATSYEYCLDTTNNAACDGAWTATANLTATASGLASITTYYWQVRARNTAGTTEADASAWRSFTTGALPAAFGKTTPVNGATGQQTALTLTWTQSVGATSYEYCVDTTNNAACDTPWTPVAGASASLSNLTAGTTYYWQVRARNAIGTLEADGGTWWSFGTTGGAPGPTVTFVGTDTTTQGTWKTTYGTQGYLVVNDGTSLPAGASVTPAGQQAWTWAASTLELPALQKVAAADRIAATWYGTTFTVDVAPGDAQAHRLSLYFLDYGGTDRRLLIEVLHPTTSAILDSRVIQNFGGGLYLTWQITGTVRIRVTLQAGPNAVLSGLFLDATP